MLDQRRVAAQPDERRERLFTERYESLLAWALRLTNQQRDRAEDLVQDAFVQFMLGRTRLEEIENIDGYLRRMLRYMHVSRMSRSAQHLHDAALSVADYDSCHLGWTAIEPPRRMQASEELHQICTYACTRKETSRAGSVLILRFFHDYFPTEIAGILNTSRHCVDQWQRLARREVKLFMNEPARLRFVDPMAYPEKANIRYLQSGCDLMLDLRQMIFHSCHNECLSQEELEAVYSNGTPGELTTAKLAHIVSCPDCLDAVNKLLGLPLLEQRFQARRVETKEPPPGPTGGGESGGGATGGGDLAQKFGHRLRTTREHKPQELRIAVNGFLVSSLKVSSELSEMNLNLTPDDPVEFVEVFSEQGVQLLFFTTNPHGSQTEQWAWIELSEGRLLEACFRTDDGPALQVVYNDPTPEEAFLASEMPKSDSLSSPLFVVPSIEKSIVPKETNRGARFRLQSWTMRLWRALQSVALFDARETTTQLKQNALVKSFEERRDEIQARPLFTLLSQTPHASRGLAWRRLRLLIVLLSALVVTGFLLFKASLSPELTATTLLDRSRAAEQVRQQTPDTVRHRSINLEERRSAEGAIVARRKIEIWEDHLQGKRALRLYDDSNRLTAAAWQKPDGSRTVYNHGSKPRSQASLATPDNLLISLEDIWQLEPSSETFSVLIAEPAIAGVEERSTTYVLKYEKERTIGASRLLQATLTLSKSDLHAIEQTLLVQRGGELREYRFVEASFELLPVKAVGSAAFEIEPELVGGAGALGRPEDWALRDLTSSRVPPSPSTSAPPVASAELEVDVAYLLNQAKADRNEQVALTRSAGGSLRVEGVVDSQQRKEEFLRALGPVSNNPAVKIEIRTISEAATRHANSSPVLIQDSENTADTVGADDVLRAYFTKKDPTAPTDEAIRSYSSRVVNRAYRALFHAIELKKLVNRFAAIDMRTVAPDARTKWLSMLREHAAAFERENGALRRELEPVFFPGASAQIVDETSIQSDGDLTGAVERLHKLALGNSDAIRSGLTISSQSSAVAIKSNQFREALVSAEKLAARIMQYEG